MKYHFRIHKEGKVFWAECIELKGCYTQANSMEKLYRNMQEALSLYVQEPEDSKDLAPFPDESIRKSKNVVEVALDPEVAFPFLVRYYRIKNGMTQQAAAKKMGYDKVYNYQRLEAKKCNPTLKIISMIKKVFPDFSIDYALSS